MGPRSDPTSPVNTCPSCGKRLPPDAPGGNCPACLWQLLSDPGNDVDPALDTPRRFGSYELVEEIARGGMGAVWRARQDGLERDVALKMILAGHLASSAQVLRFYTEARAAARLDHPNIVPIFEIGEEDGCHFYTMRLMEGKSLAQALKPLGLMPPDESARLVAVVAKAIHFAHQRGVLHCDLKPSNILLDAEGKPHVADFGLARIVDSAPEISRSGHVAGTPAYMAPEQAAGRSSGVTIAADVYALGALLYELMVGAPPFRAETPLQTLRLVTEAAPVSPRSRNPRIARDLEVVCLKCLQKEPEKRYASAAELAADLDRWLAHEPILARPVSATQRLVSWARRKPALAGALTGLLLIFAAALTVTLALLVKVRRESEARATALRAEEGQRLAFQSLAVLSDNPGQALLLALEAADRAQSLSASNALLASMEACHERRRLLGHDRGVEFASFSPDGRRAATASHDRTARIWSVETGETTCVLRGHNSVVRTAVFSSDGKRVVTSSDDATARIWEAEKGGPLVTLGGHEHPLKSAIFNPDGTRVLTVAQYTARIWDAATGRALHVLEQHDNGINCARFSPDGSRIVTGGEDSTARVWDSTTGLLLAMLPGHTERVIDVCFSADGRRIATASDPEARVWDASTHEELTAVRGHRHGIYSLALKSDGTRLATGSEDFTARIWDARTGEELHVLQHDHKVVSVDISRDDSLLVTASYDKAARVWDLRSGRLVADMRGHAAPLNHAAFSPSGREVVTSCVDFTARLWVVHPLQPLELETSGERRVVSADIAAGGGMIVEACDESATARVLDLATRREIARLAGHEDDVYLVRFSFDGTMVLTGSRDNTLRLWDARSGKGLQALRGHEGICVQGTFSPDGRRVLTLSVDGTARVWNVEDGREAAVYRADTNIASTAFAPDSDRLALTDGGGYLHMARVSSGEIQPYWREIVYRFNFVDFGREGREMVVAMGTTRVQIRDLSSGRIMATLVHPARAGRAIFSPDKRWIATLANDTVVRLWDAATHEERLNIKRPSLVPTDVQFPVCGDRVVVTWVMQGDRDVIVKEVVIYPLDVLAAARGAKFGDLTPDERDLFQVGSPEERLEYRGAWRGGHIYGQGPGEVR
ncbi:MAG TPA: protein kinase [Planctomycetota bacterium]|nr:protein kinase [Planctomycetota bacterium]